MDVASGGAVRVRGARRARLRRSTMLVVVTAVSLLGATGCTPKIAEFTIHNDTGVALVNDHGEVEAGATGTIGSDTSGCVPELMLASPDRSRSVVLEGPLCDGDERRVGHSDLVDTSARSTLSNVSTRALEVSIRGDDGFQHQSVAPGASLAVTLRRPPGQCVTSTVWAADPQAASNGVVVHPGPLCDGDVWAVDDSMVEAGSAAVTVVNRTSRGLGVSVHMAGGWTSGARVGIGSSAVLTLGLPPGDCGRGSIDGDSPDNRGREEVRLHREGPLCTSEWVLTDADLTHFDREAHGWVPLAPRDDETVAPSPRTDPAPAPVPSGPGPGTGPSRRPGPGGQTARTPCCQTAATRGTPGR